MLSEKGFTLVELLVVIAMLGILSTIGLASYSEYRNRTFHAVAEQMMHDVQVSLESGAAGLSRAAPDFYWAWTDGNGELQGWRLDEFLPGTKVEENTRLDANYNGFCAAFANQWCGPNNLCCVVSWATTRHCDGETAIQWMRWNTGLTLKNEWANWGC